MDDQDGMHAIDVAVAALALDPNPQNTFIRGDYRRLILQRHLADP
jgi:hypothetical protein